METISVTCPACNTQKDIPADEEIKIGFILVKFQLLCETCIANDAEEEE